MLGWPDSATKGRRVGQRHWLAMRRVTAAVEESSLQRRAAHSISRVDRAPQVEAREADHVRSNDSQAERVGGGWEWQDEAAEAARVAKLKRQQDRVVRSMKG